MTKSLPYLSTLPLTLAEQAMDAALRFRDRDIARKPDARKRPTLRTTTKPPAEKNAT